MTARPDHLIDLDGGWLAWKWFLVRGAGFPARTVLDVASPAAAAAADEVDGHAERAIETRSRALDEARLMFARSEGTERRALDKVIKALLRGNPVSPEAGEYGAALRALVDVEAALARARDTYAQLFATEHARTTRRLREIASDPRFREAIVWQNRVALRAIDWLLANPDADNSRAHQNEQLVASYLQRYCVKNDAIGFFGPIGFGRITLEHAGITVKPGPQLLDNRTVYFEHWCIDTLAELLARDAELLPFARPRKHPVVRLDGTVVSYPVQRRTELPLAFAHALAACDGERTARDIARHLLANDELELDGEEEVFSLLRELRDKRFCTWTFEVPTITEWPERHLRRLLEPAEGDARERAMRQLDELEAARGAVGRAAGDPAVLDAALKALEATFERLTAQNPRRRAGQTYAARTLVREDCRRHLDLTIGRSLLAGIGPALSLLLCSARWYTHRIAELLRPALDAAFDAAARGASTIDYLTFWQEAKHELPDLGVPRVVEQAKGELQAKWSAIIAIEAGVRTVDVASSAIASRVADAFAAPARGWSTARYHSPDLLISAASPEAIANGDAIVVLGELHPSVSTFHFADQKEHSERAALVRARELDLPDVTPWQVEAKQDATLSDHMWVSAHDVDIELGETRSWRPRSNVLAVGSLVVERRDGRLFVRDDERRYEFDIVEFFSSHLSAAINTAFDIFAPREHMPRVTIDGVVVHREQWRLDPPPELAASPNGSARFAAARAWARRNGFPRWVFVKVPEEPKPIYIDFDSSLYVGLLAKLLRNASRLTVTEMLPTPDNTWLLDADGQTCTCELRLIAVDPQPWQAR